MSIDAMKQALRALETVFMPHHPAVINLRLAIEQAEKQGRATAIDHCPYDTSPATDYWIEGWQACAALEQAEKQEPVAIGWMRRDETMHRGCPPIGEPDGWMPLYAAPPQQEKQEPVGSFMNRKQAIEFCRRRRPNIEPTEQQIAATIDAYAALFGDLVPAPPQRQPLTRQQIDELFEDGLGFERAEVIVRAIERAHGIGGGE